MIMIIFDEAWRKKNVPLFLFSSQFSFLRALAFICNECIVNEKNLKLIDYGLILLNYEVDGIITYRF